MAWKQVISSFGTVGSCKVLLEEGIDRGRQLGMASGQILSESQDGGSEHSSAPSCGYILEKSQKQKTPQMWLYLGFDK